MRRIHPQHIDGEKQGNRFIVLVPLKRNAMFEFSIFLFFTLILFIQPCYSSPHFLSNNPNFDPDIDLFGDAKILADHSGNGTHVKLTNKTSLTAGLLLRRQPITFSNLTSFSVEFTFSISSDVGDGLLFVLIPHDLAAAFPGNGSYGLQPSYPANSYIGVEFDTSKDDDVNDMNENHVGIDVGSLDSVAVANVSASNLVLNNGEKLKSWVDYEAQSQILEVRLSKLNELKSENPIVSHNIDLFKIWGDQSVFMGLSSSNDDNSIQVVRVYSWKVSLKNVTVSNSTQSQPVNPNEDEQQPPPPQPQPQQQEQQQEAKLDAAVKKKDRPLTFLASVIFGTVCVVLVTFVILFMWVIFFHKHEEESLAKLPENPSDVRYERIDVAVQKNAEDHEDQQH